MRRIIIVCAAFLFAGAVFGAAGTTSIDILKLPLGARSQSMGGAYTALPYNMEAMDINPAGLGFMEKNEVMSIVDFYLEDIFFSGVYYGHNMGKTGTLGVTLKYLSAGTI